MYHVSSPEATPDTAFKARAAKTEPHLFIWKHYAIDLLGLVLRRSVGIVLLGALFGISYALLNDFDEGDTKKFYEEPNDYLNRANACQEPVSMLDAYNNELLAP